MAVGLGDGLDAGVVLGFLTGNAVVSTLGYALGDLSYGVLGKSRGGTAAIAGVGFNAVGALGTALCW